VEYFPRERVFALGGPIQVFFTSCRDGESSDFPCGWSCGEAQHEETTEALHAGREGHHSERDLVEGVPMTISAASTRIDFEPPNSPLSGAFLLLVRANELCETTRNDFDLFRP